jgi:hypothetical protein
MMNTLRSRALLPILGTLMASASAQASLMINSIDVAIVSTTYNATGISNDYSAAEAASIAMFEGFMPAYFNTDTLICEESLDSFDGLTTHGTCGGTHRDNGTLFAITGTVTGPTEMQFGLDWGRGGFSWLTLGDNAPQIERYNEDIWWGTSWNNSDVLNFALPEPGDFLLIGLGFEGCCDGSNSARWRSLGSGPGDSAGEWQTLAVTVPSPGAAPLMGLGLAGLVIARRRKTQGRTLEEC